MAIFLEIKIISSSPFYDFKLLFALISWFEQYFHRALLDFFTAFADLIKSMWKHGYTDAVSPHSFKTQIQRFAPRFMGYK